MTHGEATRQLQHTLEARRSLRAEFGETLSAQDELRDADEAIAQAEAATFRAWIEERPEPVPSTARMQRTARFRPRFDPLATLAGIALGYVLIVVANLIVH